MKLKLAVAAAILMALVQGAAALSSASIPGKFPIPWANSAGSSFINFPVPTASQIGITNCAASLTDGMPPKTMQAVSAGGCAPFGQDINGILKQITLWSQWQSAGAPVFYDSGFSTSIGGYPKWTILSNASTVGCYWISQVENNSSDPDTGGANWTAGCIGSLSVGMPITGGTANNFLYDAGGTLAERASTGTGPVVLGTGPTIGSPTISGTVAGGATYSSPSFSGVVGGNFTAPGNLTFSGTDNFTGTFEIGGTPVSLPIAASIGGTGVASPAAHTVPINEGSSPQNNTGTGTTGQCLVSSGASADPAYVNGCRVLLATYTASNSATIGNSTILSGYTDYEIVFTNVIPATLNATCELQVFSGGSFQTTNYTGNIILAVSSANSVTNQSSASNIPCSFIGATYNNAPGISGSITLSSPGTNTVHPFAGVLSFGSTSTVSGNGIVGGYWNSSGIITGIQVLFSSGNITSGNIRVYGKL